MCSERERNLHFPYLLHPRTRNAAALRTIPQMVTTMRKTNQNQRSVYTFSLRALMVRMQEADSGVDVPLGPNLSMTQRACIGNIWVSGSNALSEPARKKNLN